MSKTSMVGIIYSCMLPLVIIVTGVTCAWHEYRLQRVEQNTLTTNELHALNETVNALTTLVRAFNESYDDQKSLMSTLLRSQNELLKNQTNINEAIDGISLNSEE